MKTVSEQLKEWKACTEGYEWATTNCKTMAEVWDKCERGDWLIWLLQKHGWDSRKEKLQVAVACAEHVLHIYESKYPNDDRPRKAVEAVKSCIENDTPENRAAAGAAADAAYAAADAAYAAYTAAGAAADAADAAYTAAGAAADAAGAAADAADAAERKWQAEAIRKIVANPFKKESK